MAVTSVDFQGFSPDLDPTTPGIFVATDKLIPTERGFMPMEGLDEFYPALADHCHGAYFARYLDGSSKFFEATRSHIYRGVTGAWLDVSRTSGGAYITGDTARWRWAQFGGDTIAVNGADAPQVITVGASNFAALAGSPPVSSIVAAVGGNSAPFVFMLNTSISSNQWWCSGIGNDATWTPDIGTQAANGQLSDTEGPIVGAHSLGPQIIIYKLRSTYIGQYVGPPLIWAFQVVSDRAGAQSHEAVVSVGDRHLVFGYDDFYMFDGGSPPTPLSPPLRRFLFEEGDFDRNYNYLVWGAYDRRRQCVYWHYPSVEAPAADKQANTLDKYVCVSLRSNRWTHGTMRIEARVTPELSASPSLTYGDLGTTIFTDYASMTGFTYGSPLFNGSTDVVQAVVKEDHKTYTFTGAPQAATLKTGDFGSPGYDPSFWRRSRPRFSTFPSGGIVGVKTYGRMSLGDTQQQAGTSDLTPQGYINVRQSRRYHALEIDLPARVHSELIGIDHDLEPAGER